MWISRVARLLWILNDDDDDDALSYVRSFVRSFVRFFVNRKKKDVFS